MPNIVDNLIEQQQLRARQVPPRLDQTQSWKYITRSLCAVWRTEVQEWVAQREVQDITAGSLEFDGGSLIRGRLS